MAVHQDLSSDKNTEVIWSPTQRFDVQPVSHGFETFITNISAPNETSPTLESARRLETKTNRLLS